MELEALLIGIWKAIKMALSFKNYIQNNKFIENFSYLALAKLFNLLLPLIIFPYLINVLGAKLYGQVVYAQVISTYFAIIINYGFAISGARDAAQSKHNKYQLSKVVSTILVIQFIIFILCLLLLTTILFFLQLEKSIFLLYFFSFFICLNTWLFPQWFFQGIEKIKYTTIINLLIQGVFLLLTLILVKDKSDFLLVPILNSVGAILGGGASLYVIFHKENISFIPPTSNEIVGYLRANTSLFLSELIISVKDRFSIIFIGLSLGMSDVAIYDFGVKVMGLFIALIGVINSAAFPKMAIEKSKRILKRIMKYSFYFIFLLVLLTQLFMPYIIQIANISIPNAILTIQILLLCPIISSLSLPLAGNGLIAFGYDKLFMLGMLLTTLFYSILLSTFHFLSILDSVQTFAIITLLVYTFELIYRYIVCKKVKIL